MKFNNMFIFFQFYPQDPSSGLGKNFAVKSENNYQDSCPTVKQVLSSTLPADLQDINLDKSIDWGLSLPGDGKFSFVDI